MRTNFDTRMDPDAGPRASADAGTQVTLPRGSITPLQWTCLRDAAAGRTLAPARHRQQVWGEAEDGAIFHSAQVLRTLHRYGFLERRENHRYIACEKTRSALTLPIRSR